MDNVSVARTELSFSDMLDHLRGGDRRCWARRYGWNGTGMMIGIMAVEPSGDMDREYLWILGADGMRSPWTPSQVDILANDWEVLSAHEDH